MEIFKDIKGYEGLYQISDMGNVRSLKFGKKRILKPGKNKDNYLHVNLCKDGKPKKYSVHRLVAETFIPKVEGKTYVDHIDGNRQNNNVNNLRWCSQIENNNFDLYRKHMSEAKKGEKSPMYGKTGALHPNSKAVICVELNRIFESITEAEQELGIKQQSISACCRGKLQSAGKLNGEKLHWEYVN